MASDIIASFFFDVKIGCDNPYPSWFIDKLYNSYNEENIFSIHSLNHLMNDMGIPGGYNLQRIQISRNIENYTLPSSFNKCYSAEELIEIHQFSKNSMSKEDLQLMTPALAYIRANNLCGVSFKTYSISDSLASTQTKIEAKISTIGESIIVFMLFDLFIYLNIFIEYGYGSLAVFVTSLLGFAGILMIPYLEKEFYDSLLVALTALAISTLFCGVNLHVLPEVCNLNRIIWNLIFDSNLFKKILNCDQKSDSIEVPTYTGRICIFIGGKIFFIITCLL